MRRKVIMACDGVIATSTTTAEEIKELYEANNTQLNLVQCRIAKIETYMDRTSPICTTTRVDHTFGDIPVVHDMPFVSDVSIKALQQRILAILVG